MGIGKNRQDVAKEVGISIFRIDRYMRQAKGIKPAEFQMLFNALCTADEHLKTGYQTDGMVLTLLIHKFRSIFSRNDVDREYRR